MTDAADGDAEDDGTEGGAFSRALDGVLNKALVTQWNRACQTVASHRRRNVDATPEEIASDLVKEFVRDIAVIGAAGGAVAAVPGPGTLVKVTGGTVVETGMLLERASYMILGVAEAYGHDLADMEVRRFAVLRVLGAWAGVSGGATGVAGTMGAGLGKKATQAIPMTSIHAFNRAVGKQVLFKWSARAGTIRLGSVLPFGIGAGIGGTANYVIGRGLGKAAIHEFRPKH